MSELDCRILKYSDDGNKRCPLRTDEKCPFDSKEIAINNCPIYVSTIGTCDYEPDAECPYPFNNCELCNIYKNHSVKCCEKVEDNVNHPSHYTKGKFECIDVIMDILSSHKDPVASWFTGQIIKYIWRWPFKNGLEDLKKSRFYLDKLISYLEENDEDK